MRDLKIGFDPFAFELLLWEVFGREITEGTVRIFRRIVISPRLVMLIGTFSEDAGQMVLSFLYMERPTDDLGGEIIPSESVGQGGLLHFR